MLVFTEQNLAYLATPKTGSTAIEAALRPHADIILRGRRKHMPAQRFRRKMLPFLDSAFGVRPETVAMIREPISQIRSWYKYRARAFKAGSPYSTQGLSFDQFVLDLIAEDPPQHALIGSQLAFLSDRTGALVVDHLFAYEHQPVFLDFLEERIGPPITLPRKNVSPPIEAPLSERVEAQLRAARTDEFSLHSQVVAAKGHLAAGN
ncbi:MAG: hypothetical protein AAGG57_02805 [Pseudomonadota bacterium]